MARLGGGDTHDGKSVGSSPLSWSGDEFMGGTKSGWFDALRWEA